MEDIKNYLQTEKPKVLPKSPIGDAIDYTLSNWEALLRYTEDGELEIDNNGAERSLRPIWFRQLDLAPFDRLIWPRPAG